MEEVSHVEPSEHSRFEARLRAKEELESIWSLFDDDPEGLAVVRCRAEGMKASAIRTELGIGDTAWETVRKRIRRKFIQHLGNLRS